MSWDCIGDNRICTMNALLMKSVTYHESTKTESSFRLKYIIQKQLIENTLPKTRQKATGRTFHS